MKRVLKTIESLKDCSNHTVSEWNKVNFELTLLKQDYQSLDLELNTIQKKNKDIHSKLIETLTHVEQLEHYVNHLENELYSQKTKTLMKQVTLDQFLNEYKKLKK